MSLDDLVNVQIDQQTAQITRAGFGTIMILSTEAAVSNTFAGQAKLYGNDIAEFGPNGDNYDTDGVLYKLVQIILSQNPKTNQIVVGKRATAPTMTVTLTPVVQNSTAYTVTIGGEAFTFTSDATATDLEIVAGLIALINAGTQNVLASGTTVLSIEAADTPGGSVTAGVPYTITFDRGLWAAQNTTPDPGVVADLTAVRSAIDGNDDFYALILDSFGKAEVKAVAANIETLRKLYFSTTFDADVLTAVTTDLASELNALGYTRTILSWHETPLFQDLSAGWAGGQLPKDPGSITWKFKGVTGVAFSTFTPAEAAELKAKKCNNYVRKAGVSMMQEGVVVGGEFIDIVRGIDFIAAELQAANFEPMANLPKIGFDDDDIPVFENRTRGVMDLGVTQKIFVRNPPPVVTVPTRAETSSADRAIRLLKTIEWSAELAGAVHATEIRGVVTV